MTIPVFGPSTYNVSDKALPAQITIADLVALYHDQPDDMSKILTFLLPSKVARETAPELAGMVIEFASTFASTEILVATSHSVPEV